MAHSAAGKPSCPARRVRRIAGSWLVGLLCLIASLAIVPVGHGTGLPRPIPPPPAALLTGSRSSSPVPAGGIPRDAPAPASSPPGSNATPVGEVGTLLAPVSVGGHPQGLAYDPANGRMYEGDPTSGNELVLNGSNVVGNVSLGALPGAGGGCFDPGNGYLYIAINASNALEVLSGTRVVANVTVQVVNGSSVPAFYGPIDAVYDASDGFVYVPNGNSINPGYVTVLNGTTVIARVPTGNYPIAASYDPVDGDVYVAAIASPSNGGSEVDVINGTSVVGRITQAAGSFSYPRGLSFDPVNQYLYVPNVDLVAPASSTVTVLDPTAQAPLRVDTVLSGFDSAWWSAVDPWDGYVYVANHGGNDLTVLNGTTFVGNVSVGAAPYWVTYDTGDGDLYVTTPGNGAVVLISATLGAGPLTSSSGETGELLAFRGSVWAVGDGHLTTSVSTGPASGLGCPANGTLSSVLTAAIVTFSCRPTLPGSYALWLNVTDGIGDRVWSEAGVTVTPGPDLSEVQPSRISGDVGQIVTFHVAIRSNGTGTAHLTWAAPTGLGCGGSQTTELLCLPTQPNAQYVVTATLVDASGVRNASSASVVTDPDPSLGTPTLSRATVVAGTPVTIAVSVTGGSGSWNLTWVGLPGPCSGTSLVVACVPIQSGVFPILVTVVDSNGFSVTSSSVSLTVTPVPALAAPFPLLLVALIAGVAVAAGIGVILLRRHRAPPPRETSGADPVVDEPS